MARVFVFIAFLFAGFSAPAATYVISGGQLMGANGVDVGGKLFNVSFLDGLCGSVYSGCNAADDFTFNTEAEAVLASAALLDQVFNLGDFYDANPFYTNGIATNSSGNVFTPWTVSNHVVMARYVWNSMHDANDQVYPTSMGIGDWYDLSTDSTMVWAKWEEVAPVPVPAALWLFASGLAGLGFVRRNRG